MENAKAQAAHARLPRTPRLPRLQPTSGGDARPPSEDRIVAQLVSTGTWDDIRRLECVYSPEELRSFSLACNSPRLFSRGLIEGCSGSS